MQKSFTPYIYILLVMVFAAADVMAKDIVSKSEVDTMTVREASSLFPSVSVCDKDDRSALMKIVDGVMGFISPDVDTAYIEPQKYNMTAMAQGTVAIDRYTIRSGEDYRLTVAPEDRINVGPFLGWRWLFLGYTFDISLIDFIGGNTDINFNAYSSAVGINLLYRRLDGYKIKDAMIGGVDYTEHVLNVALPGVTVDVEGINGYYVLNNSHYSHQAAYSQTNRQLRSAGSWIVGAGYDHSRVNADWKEVAEVVSQRTGKNIQFPANTKIENEIDYRSVSGSVGYGYNWVFSRNWLVGAQLIGSASYFWKTREADEVSHDDPNVIYAVNRFFKRNMTFDVGVKLGVVWNTSQWFAGASAILNSYNYHDDSLWASNSFGTINFYVGYNFWKM